MLLLDLTLDSPAENLALDEALLLAAESGAQAEEVLRLWEPRQFMIVLGSSSRMLKEVRLANTRQRRIEILRRSSGGAAVMAGPGCLMYALVLDRRRRAELRGIDTTHRWVLDRLVAALAPLVPGVACRGTSDLVLSPIQELPEEKGTGTFCTDSTYAADSAKGASPLPADSAKGDSPRPAERGTGTFSSVLPGSQEPPDSGKGASSLARKFSGNSLRVKRDWLLYHGTLLYDFPLPLLGTCLGTPPRQPAYRAGRRHVEFVANLPLAAPALRTAIAATFDAREPLTAWPAALTAQLAAEKFTRDEWTYRL